MEILAICLQTYAVTGLVFEEQRITNVTSLFEEQCKDKNSHFKQFSLNSMVGKTLVIKIKERINSRC